MSAGNSGGGSERCSGGRPGVWHAQEGGAEGVARLEVGSGTAVGCERERGCPGRGKRFSAMAVGRRREED